jgi:predicted dehydrogenase
VTGPIRVGVIGCGEITQVMHLRFIDELPELKLVALCDLSSAVLEHLGAKYRVDHLYISYEELVSDSEVDAVLVATPDHPGPALAALDRGKHLLLEKPAAYSIAGARDVAEATDKSPATAMMAYMRVYDPGHELMRAQMEKMSPVRLVRSHDFGGNFARHGPLFPLVRPRPEEGLRDQFAETISARTAAILEQAVGSDQASKRLLWSLLMGATHDLSVVRDLIGPPREVLYSHVDGSRLLAGISHEQAVCTFEWDTASGYEWWDQELTVYGSDRTCVTRFADPYIPYVPTGARVHSLEQGTAAIHDLDVPSEPAFRREWRHFAECIRSGQEPRTTISGGLHDVELIVELVRTGTQK